MVSRLTREKRTRNPLETPNGIVSSSEGKAEVFADCMESQFTVHRGVSDPGHSAEVRDFLSGYFSHPPAGPDLPFDRDELVSSVCRLNLSLIHIYVKDLRRFVQIVKSL